MKFNSSMTYDRSMVWYAVLIGTLLQTGCATGGGAPWTILCLELNGPNRTVLMSQFAQTLKRTPGIRPNDVTVVNSSDDTIRLYYSTYYRKTDFQTGRRTQSKRLRDDLNLIKQLGDQSKRRYFIQAIPVRMPTPDVGFPSWDLKNVNATYSLQVAFFESTDDFWEHKKAAAEYCKFLRKKGYEAYYYHTDPSSTVMVGAFGPEALITRANGRTYYSEEVLALQRKEFMQYNLLNSKTYSATNDQGKRVLVSSRLVITPQASNP